MPKLPSWMPFERIAGDEEEPKPKPTRAPRPTKASNPSTESTATIASKIESPEVKSTTVDDPSTASSDFKTYLVRYVHS